MSDEDYHIETPTGLELWRNLWGNGTRILISVSVACLVLLGVVLFLVVRLWTVSSIPDPLGKYDIQTVKNRVPGITGPAIPAGEPADIVAVKCADEPTKLATQVYWQLREDGSNVGGVSIKDGNFVSTLPVGCNTQRFSNPMPADVVRIAENHPGSLWAVTGTDQPINRDGQHVGQDREWQSENFQIVS